MDPIQILTAILTIMGLSIGTDLYFKLGDKRRYLVPVIIYLIHVVIFYLARTLTGVFGFFPNYLEYFSFTNWSAAVRLQGVFTILYFLIILGRYDEIICEKLIDTKVGKMLWKNGCKR